MRIVYMGTPDFAVPALEALSDAHDVALVVTRPDAVRSRGKALEPSAVKARAMELGLRVIEAARLDAEAQEAISAAEPDVIAVAAFGCIVPDSVIAMPRLECVNIHASLLPRWRGAAPVQRALLAGDERVGVSIMRIAHDLDAGAYCRQASVDVDGRGADELLGELAELGARELLAALDDIEAGSAIWVEQDESLVTLAPKIDKLELRLDPGADAMENVRRVQASSDAAPARAQVAGKGVRIMRAHGAAGVEVGEGEVACSGGRVVLGCAAGALEVDEVKPDGKRAMEASAWAAGLRGDSLAWGVI